MSKRAPIVICLVLGTFFGVGVACTSIPNRKFLSYGAGGPDSGVDGSAAGGGGGSSAGGRGGTAGAGGSSGNGGTVVDGGGGGNGGTGNAGGTDGGQPDASLPGIKCGTTTCHDRAVGAVTLAACCAGAGKTACGLETVALGVISCVEPNQFGKLNSNCDDANGNGDTLKGCCRPGSGTCGLMLDPVGGPNFGCVDPTEVGVSTTGSCTAPSCKKAGNTCTLNSDCCSGTSGSGSCVTFSGATSATCTAFCETNRDCASGCCVLLTNGRGACAPDASSCSAKCRVTDETCDVDSDCCSGNVCAPNSSAGPRICRPLCTTNADCPATQSGTSYCVKDASGRATCTTDGAGLCTDTCYDAKSGTCNDGNVTSGGAGDCALGSDCTDCGPQLGGFSLCDDSCSTAKNGSCEDSGTGSTGSSCGFGTDCTDCGPRLGLCSDDCPSHDDGSCDDGGSNADTDDCAFGTDCDDCGPRLGGRGQIPCDGSTGYDCTSTGGEYWGEIADGSCQCSDCAWDKGPQDCVVTANKCNGTAISACCAPGNPCGLDNDGTCDCGGWCDWEKNDCGIGAFGPRCDGVTISSYCSYTNPDVSDGFCDCDGACSWEGTDCSGYGTCKDTCTGHLNNGICEDGGQGSSTAVCAKGTDCADCGPR